MALEHLFSSYNLNGLELKNRIVMAPLTRCNANEKLEVTDTIATYYARRADAGLIITEATQISPDAQGYPNTPGIYNEGQVEAWKKVTDAVHEKGGKIFLQIWHCGRISHSFFHGTQPIAPSAIALEGTLPLMRHLSYEEPRAMTEEDIHTVIENFAKAARNAKRAGFDGVEIHGANSYLLDQFMHYCTNQRDDKWGGSPENMARIVLEVIKATKQEIEHVGIRLSPATYVNMEHDPRDVAVYEYALAQLEQSGVDYVHTGILYDNEYDYLGGSVTSFLRKHYKGTVIGCGGYSPEAADKLVEEKGANLVAIARPFIANADYVERVRNGKPLVEYDDAMLTSELI